MILQAASNSYTSVRAKSSGQNVQSVLSMSRQGTRIRIAMLHSDDDEKQGYIDRTTVKQLYATSDRFCPTVTHVGCSSAIAMPFCIGNAKLNKYIVDGCL
jgi:hypothetical protein